MNTGQQQDSNVGSPGASFSLEDILFTLFRHKVLILSFVGLGLVAAIVVRIIKPPVYKSEAKISVRYVVELSGVNPPSAENTITSPGSGVTAVMDSQVEILRSLDTAAMAADIVGLDRILADYPVRTDRFAAGGLIASGLTIEPPRTATLSVTFKHPDKTLVQPVMDAVIKAYMIRHDQMYRGVGVMDEFYRRQRDESRDELNGIEGKLKALKMKVGVVELQETKHTYQKQIAELTDQLYGAQRDVAQRTAAYGDQNSTSTATNAADYVPAEKAAEYGELVPRLEETRRKIRRLLIDYTEYYPEVVRSRAMEKELNSRKAELLKEFPSLSGMAVGIMLAPPGATNASAMDVESAMSEIKSLKRNLAAISNQLAEVKTAAFQLMEVEPEILDLERRRDDARRAYEFALKRLNETKTVQEKGVGQEINLYPVQSPSPPALDTKKLLKLLAGAFGGCVGLGLGLAFLIDLVLDQTIRRASDVARCLHLPLFLSIPASENSLTKATASSAGARRNSKRPPAAQPIDEADQPQSNAVAPWRPDHHMQLQIEGLRERVITHFDIKGINHKPKLVALTACDLGAGVTTLATGLAAALSRTGEGSVLLVDLNAADGGRTYSFYRGKPGCGPSESPSEESATEHGTNPKNALSLTKPASESAQMWEKLEKLLPRSFDDLVPKLKANEYDYIIFDMAIASPTNITPRLAGHMDLVLMILEAGKTGQHRARKAAQLMRESRANVVAVLNKYRNFIPAALSHE